MANYLLSHTGAQIDEAVSLALAGVQDGSITAAKIQDGSITSVKLNSSVFATSADIVSGTSSTTLITPAALSESGIISSGAVNVIRNPKFTVNQRTVSGTVTLSAGAYGHDGWKAGSSGCTYTFATSQGRTTLTITAGSLVQTVDGLDLAAGANTYTLSWGGTCQGKIGAGSYGASGITGLTTGGTNIDIEFSTGTLYEPQFEQGNIPSVFDQRPYSYDLGICERFYRKCSGYVIGFSSASSRKFISSPLPPMRATPTVVGISDSVGNVGKITTYDTVGNPTTNVTPTAFAVSNVNNILLAYAFVDNSTASGIFCSWTIGAEP